MTVEIAKEKAFTGIGEGPFWDEDTSLLYLVDFTSQSGRILKFDGQNIQVAKHIGAATFVIPTTRHSLTNEEFIIAEKQSLYYANFSSPDIKLISTVEKDLQTRFNDGKCDSRGRLWAGTMSLERIPNVVFAEHIAALYSYESTKTKPEVQQDKVTLSNGIAWNVENTRLFFADSIERKIYAFDFNEETGKISNRSVLTDFSNTVMEEYGMPDGCCIDAQNNLWIAMFRAGKVLKINIVSGKIEKEILFPAKLTTSVCFGGANYETLYVTSAIANLSEEELKQQPYAGSLFMVRDLGVRGIKPDKFKIH